MSCITPLGEDSWNFVPGFLWTLPHVLFLFADFVLYPSTIIKLSCEYDYILNPVSLLDLEDGLGDLKIN